MRRGDLHQFHLEDESFALRPLDNLLQHTPFVQTKTASVVDFGVSIVSRGAGGDKSRRPTNRETCSRSRRDLYALKALLATPYTLLNR